MYGKKEAGMPRLFLLVPVALTLASLVPATGLCAGEEATKQIPVATVNGSIISEADLESVVAGQVRQLRQQEYEIKSKALEQIIEKRLWEEEAAKQGITVDQLTNREVNSKVGQPTDAEVEAYYLAQKDKQSTPLDDVRPQVRLVLRYAKMQQAKEQYVTRLKSNAKIQIVINPPRVEVEDDPKRVRGNAVASVTIVEFSDFHCPFCKRAQPTLNEIMSRYEGKVRLSFRDMPLVSLHPRARVAAEAARCAQDQGKFWEYHDVLFAQAPKANDEDLKQFARELGLDGEKFGRCLFVSQHRDAVQRDIEEGTKLGITGTPAFFINGRFLNGAQPLEKFVQIIDEELARAERGTAVSMGKTATPTN